MHFAKVSIALCNEIDCKANLNFFNCYFNYTYNSHTVSQSAIVTDELEYLYMFFNVQGSYHTTLFPILATLLLIYWYAGTILQSLYSYIYFLCKENFDCGMEHFHNPHITQPNLLYVILLYNLVHINSPIIRHWVLTNIMLSQTMYDKTPVSSTVIDPMFSNILENVFQQTMHWKVF